MSKVRFSALIKAIAYFSLPTLLVVIVGRELGLSWQKTVIIVLFVKFWWYCIEKGKFLWGVYVSKKQKNMYINNCVMKKRQLVDSINLHNELCGSNEKEPKKESEGETDD